MCTISSWFIFCDDNKDVQMNNIKTIQYQINHDKLTNTKLFLFINGQTKILDYIINNQMFDKELEEIGSSLSTLRIN